MLFYVCIFKRKSSEINNFSIVIIKITFVLTFNGFSIQHHRDIGQTNISEFHHLEKAFMIQKLFGYSQLFYPVANFLMDQIFSCFEILMVLLETMIRSPASVVRSKSQVRCTFLESSSQGRNSNFSRIQEKIRRERRALYKLQNLASVFDTNY